MWHEPFLESCCRSALHRLVLCEDAGRPPGMKDEPCLARLRGLGFAARDHEGRYAITPAGRARHASEVERAG